MTLLSACLVFEALLLYGYIQVPGCLPIIGHPYVGHMASGGFYVFFFGRPDSQINQAGDTELLTTPWHFTIPGNAAQRCVCVIFHTTRIPQLQPLCPNDSCHLNFIFYFSGNHKGALPTGSPEKPSNPQGLPSPFAGLAGPIKSPVIEFGLRMKSHKDSAAHPSDWLTPGPSFKAA